MSQIFKFGNNIDTDGIISAKWASLTNPEEFASHCFENLRPNFAKEVKPGDIIIAGENFGCGSSRERAPLSIQACGIKVVIAKSFARIFFRNAINIGLPIMTIPNLPDHINENDKIDVNLLDGMIKLHRTGETYKAEQIPTFIQEIVTAGGIVSYYKKIRGPLLQSKPKL
jgi:3-isopropylmalate/(R)-2-methylmalate dehydratase small subunit